MGCPLVASKQRAQDLEIARAFGRRVRELRTSAGMTQEQLAETSGLHPTFISNLERGYRVPTLPTVMRIASGLGLEAAELLRWD